MYRAIKVFNGGESIEYTHYNGLNSAYESLVPEVYTQQDERWHIKLLPAVRREFEEYHASVITIGWNELETGGETRYIQYVDTWKDALPSF